MTYLGRKVTPTMAPGDRPGQWWFIDWNGQPVKLYADQVDGLR